MITDNGIAKPMLTSSKIRGFNAVSVQERDMGSYLAFCNQPEFRILMRVLSSFK